MPTFKSSEGFLFEDKKQVEIRATRRRETANNIMDFLRILAPIFVNFSTVFESETFILLGFLK
jgi:hypothetical protein